MSYSNFPYSFSGLYVSFVNFVFVYVLMIPGSFDLFGKVNMFCRLEEVKDVTGKGTRRIVKRIHKIYFSARFTS